MNTLQRLCRKENNMIAFMPMRICDCCIEAIKSHGEKIFVDSDTEESKCNWCDEVTDTHEVLMNV